jgi:hypothetical protein
MFISLLILLIASSVLSCKNNPENNNGDDVMNNDLVRYKNISTAPSYLYLLPINEETGENLEVIIDTMSAYYILTLEMPELEDESKWVSFLSKNEKKPFEVSETIFDKLKTYDISDIKTPDEFKGVDEMSRDEFIDKYFIVVENGTDYMIPGEKEWRRPEGEGLVFIKLCLKFNLNIVRGCEVGMLYLYPEN